MASHVSLPGDVSLITGGSGLSGAGVSVSPGDVALVGVGAALGGADTTFPELTIISIAGTAAHSSTIAVTLGWTGASPSGFTGQWNPGAIASTVTLFALEPDQKAIATFSTPSTPGTYQLTVTGLAPNTAVVISGNVVVT